MSSALERCEDSPGLVLGTLKVARGEYLWTYQMKYNVGTFIWTYERAGTSVMYALYRDVYSLSCTNSCVPYCVAERRIQQTLGAKASEPTYPESEALQIYWIQLTRSRTYLYTQLFFQIIHSSQDTHAPIHVHPYTCYICPGRAWVYSLACAASPTMCTNSSW